MALPTLTKTWIIDPCNRITYVSLLDTMQRYLYQIKEFLKANGWTVKGSASAGTGAMDAVDRWTVSTDVTPRATVAAASQAWIVLTSSGSGVDLCLNFRGSTDDICRQAFSPGGLYVAAGTPNQQPTATDEVEVDGFGQSVIGNQTSGDRLWSGWVTSDAKMCRFAIARAGIWGGVFGNGRPWGIETYVATPIVTPAYPTPLANPTLIYATDSNSLPNGSIIGKTRLTVASIAYTANVHWGMETFVNSTFFGNEKPQLQGGLGYPIYPLSYFSNTAGAKGKLGNAIDIWQGRTSGDLPGDTYGALQFIVMLGGSGGTAGTSMVYPWDGVTVPVMT